MNSLELCCIIKSKCWSDFLVFLSWSHIPCFIERNHWCWIQHTHMSIHLLLNVSVTPRSTKYHPIWTFVHQQIIKLFLTWLVKIIFIHGLLSHISKKVSYTISVLLWQLICYFLKKSIIKKPLLTFSCFLDCWLLRQFTFETVWYRGGYPLCKLNSLLLFLLSPLSFLLVIVLIEVIHITALFVWI